MLKHISQWFENQFEDHKQAEPAHTVELATAVLLYEIMRADEKFEESERVAYESILTTKFSLSAEELQVLMEMTKQKADYAADFQQFTRILNEQCASHEKHAILDSLWQLAYADKNIDAHEEHLIRRIADLLHIPHSQYIQSKLRTIEK